LATKCGDISNNNAGNVGIGIIDPAIAKLQVVESNKINPSILPFVQIICQMEMELQVKLLMLVGNMAIVQIRNLLCKVFDSVAYNL
jgi:hypothetical protein